MHISAFFAGVRMISEDIGKLPFPVYRSISDDQRERARDTRWWKLLHDAPNAWMDSQQFRELLTTFAIMRGDGIALINRVRNEARELLPVRPDRVTIEQLPDYGLIYHVTDSSGRLLDFLPRDVFHLRGFSLDGVSGVSVIKYARQTLGLSLALERHGASQFGNGAKPSGIYKHPSELSDRAYERVKQDIEDLKGEGTGGTLILEEGMDWQQVGLSNEDAQFLESRKFQISEVARWLRIPPHKLADLDRSTNNNIEHQSIEYITDTLLTWSGRWERAVKRQLIGPGDLYAEILFDAMLRPTTKERFEAYRIATGRPWMSAAEVRQRENLPFNDDPTLQEVFMPANGAAGDPGAPGSPAPNPVEDSRAA